MKENTCAVVCSSPLYFPWGYDEEDERCQEMKFILQQEIFHFYTKGVCQFSVAVDSGFGLYSAEIINNLCQKISGMELICYLPYEEQATKWSPDLRGRYFDALAKCSNLFYVDQHYSPGCRYKAKLAALEAATHAVVVHNGMGSDPYMNLLVSLLDNREYDIVSVQPKRQNRKYI